MRVSPASPSSPVALTAPEAIQYNLAAKGHIPGNHVMKPAESASRRRFLVGMGAGLGSLAFRAVRWLRPPAQNKRRPPSSKTAKPIPLIHTTDLYNPPQDPDDHVDLATVHALPELDLQAVILDPTRKFLGELDPGFVPVAQMNYLTGRAVPVAAGPSDPLRSPSDTATDRPAVSKRASGCCWTRSAAVKARVRIGGRLRARDCGRLEP